MKLTNDEKEDLRALLEEYLEIFKVNKGHQKALRKEPCSNCELCKSFIIRLT